MAQALITMEDGQGGQFAANPREILARIVQRFAERGLTPVVAVELEFFLLEAGKGKPKIARGLHSGEQPQFNEVYSLREMEDFKPFFDDLYAACDVQGIPLESAISEYAPGQFELTLRHKADALRATDDALMYKRLVKGVAAPTPSPATIRQARRSCAMRSAG